MTVMTTREAKRLTRRDKARKRALKREPEWKRRAWRDGQYAMQRRGQKKLSDCP